MNGITNPIFSNREKQYMEFILQFDFPEKAAVMEQLNKMVESDITRDVTPHYWIMEFRPNGIHAGHGPMRPYIGIEVLHGHGIAPTEFTLYQRNGIVFELEIYNADSSAMDLDAIMDGEVCVRSAPLHAIKDEERRDTMLFIQYPPCSTCQKAKKWLDAKGISYTDRHIKDHNPTYEELKMWYEKSGLPLKRFFNTSGLLYKSLNLKDKLPTMTEEEQLRLLATDGMLVKRPILVSEKYIFTGFKESEWEMLLR